MEHILYNQNIRERIYIEAHNINKNIDQILYNKIATQYGDRCNSSGYIIKKSIQIINKSDGEISTINGKSIIIYDTLFNCDIINPKKDDEIECYVKKMNRAGLICYYKIETDTSFENTPMIIIVPYTDAIKNIEVNKKIKISVKSIRLKHNSNKIQIVGELV